MSTHRTLPFLLLFVLSTLSGTEASGRRIPVTKPKVRHGVPALCTEAINRAIAKAGEGDTVVIGAGSWTTATIYLKSHMTLLIEEGATLVAATDPELYGHYQPSHDMSRYDTGEGTRNANLTGDARWTRALILGQHIEDVTLCGGGTIDGMHIEDPLGEEQMRGPHTLLLAEAENIRVEDLHMVRASNYAVLGYELKDCHFRNLTIEQGWDGIHIRGGERIVISDCDIATGDDALAGGYWQGMEIRHCLLNSSCNGLRIIEPSQQVKVNECRIYGPGRFPHRTRLERPIAEPLPAGHDLIYGIVIEPGAWGKAPGRTDGIVIENVSIDNSWAPVAYTMGEDNTCGSLTMKNVEGTHIRGVAQPVNRQDCIQSWDVMTLQNVSVSK